MSYRVCRTDQPLGSPDADWERPLWAGAEALDITHFPWQDSGHRPRTRARLLYDDRYIAIIFRVEDRYVRAVAEKFQDNKDRIFDLMEQALDVKIRKLLYAKAEQLKLEKRLFRDYGWTLRVPMGYEVFKEFPEENFVWLRKQQPHRWIFVFWEETGDVTVTPEGCLNKRDEIGRTFYEGDQIVREHTSADQVEYAGRRALRLAGLWENTKSYMGGPFRTYCFYDERATRRYMVDVAVFAAGVEKEPYLRQLDLIAHTFSTAPLEVWK